MPQKRVDLTGEVFGTLCVQEYFGFFGGRAKWRCLCSCGEEVIVAGVNLRSGNTQSCGQSLKHASGPRLKERYQMHGPWLPQNHKLTHGMSRDGLGAHGGQANTTYSVWAGMKERCTNPNHVGWEYYGARGIVVCEEWANSFEAFLRDMGEKPADRTLDRIDVNGNYEKNNCRWATAQEQANNKRRS